MPYYEYSCQSHGRQHAPACIVHEFLRARTSRLEAFGSVGPVGVWLAVRPFIGPVLSWGLSVTELRALRVSVAAQGSLRMAMDCGAWQEAREHERNLVQGRMKSFIS